MPIPLAVAIPAIASIVGTAIQGISQGSANRQNREMADAQRDFNLDMWHKQNQYNHPTAQMQRLKDAGLNPRLIYGQSSGAAAGNAGDVAGYTRAEAQSVMRGTDVMGQFFQLREQTARTDNIQAQTEVQRQEAALKSLQALNIATDTDRKKFDLALAGDIRNWSVDSARANAEKALADAQKAHVEADYAKGLNQAQLNNLRQQLDNLIATRQGIGLENELKKVSLQLRREGVTESDSVILRMLVQNPVFNEAMQMGKQYAVDIWNNFVNKALKK